MEVCIQTASWYREDDPEWSFRYIKECGFDSIDYAIDYFLTDMEILEGHIGDFLSQSLSQLLIYYKPIKEAAQKNQVTFSQMHAPFPMYIDGDEVLNQKLFDVAEKCCRICEFLNCPILVVHPCTCPDKEQEKAVNLKLYKSLLPVAKSCGITICLENMFTYQNGHLMEAACADVDEVCWYIDTLNGFAGRDIFGFCLDIGHANLMRKNLREYIKRLDSRLKILHIHDNDGMVDAHVIPYTQAGKGCVNWEAVLDGLKKIQYRGAISFEPYGGIDRLPLDVQPEGLKLMSAIGKYFRKEILAEA